MSPSATSASSRPPRNLFAPRSGAWQSAHEWLRSPTFRLNVACPRAIAARASGLEVSIATGRPFPAILTSIVIVKLSSDSAGYGRPVVSWPCASRKSSRLITRPNALTCLG